MNKAILPLSTLPLSPASMPRPHVHLMNTENIIRALAGSLVLLSLALARLLHPNFLLLAAFVGLNLLQSAFTGLCPAESIIRRLRRKAPAPTPPCCNHKPMP